MALDAVNSRLVIASKDEIGCGADLLSLCELDFTSCVTHDLKTLLANAFVPEPSTLAIDAVNGNYLVGTHGGEVIVCPYSMLGCILRDVAVEVGLTSADFMQPDNALDTLNNYYLLAAVKIISAGQSAVSLIGCVLSDFSACVLTDLALITDVTGGHPNLVVDNGAENVVLVAMQDASSMLVVQRCFTSPVGTCAQEAVGSAVGLGANTCAFPSLAVDAARDVVIVAAQNPSAGDNLIVYR